MNYQKESYRLYLEKKTISEISKILNIEENLVQQHIISAKLDQNFDKNIDNNILKNLLVLDKNKRIQKISSFEYKDIEKLNLEIYNFLNLESNNPEDCALVIWIIGELKLKKFDEYLKKLSFSYNGNIKRMVFSTMGKIYNPEFVPYLKQGCKDKKPQVRSYAIKSFAKYNTEDKLDFLRKIYKQETEEYNRKIILKVVKEG